MVASFVHPKIIKHILPSFLRYTNCIANLFNFRKMAASNEPEVQISTLNTGSSILNQSGQAAPAEVDNSERGQWLRAGLLGANDGLVSVASLMLGIGAESKDGREMLLAGFAGLVSGACNMAIAKFVSVSSQRDIEIAQRQRDQRTIVGDNEENLPKPMRAAMAAALAFSLGALVPILAAASIASHAVRLVAVISAVSIALVVFGGVGAKLGNTPVLKSCARVLVGGLVPMGITYGLTKLMSLYVLHETEDEDEEE